MLVFSVMSPLAVHVHAQDSQSSSPSVPGDCTADQKYQRADSPNTNYNPGDNIPQGTKVHAVDPNGNVNQYATYKCDNGKIVVALTVQPGRFLPVMPSAGAAVAPISTQPERPVMPHPVDVTVAP